MYDYVWSFVYGIIHTYNKAKSSNDIAWNCENPLLCRKEYYIYKDLRVKRIIYLEISEEFDKSGYLLL